MLFRSCFEPQVPPYDIAVQGIIVWPGERYVVEAFYDLDAHPTIVPRPQAVADGFGLPVIDSQRLIFRNSSILWAEWIAVWEDTPRAGPAPLSHVRLLRNGDHAKHPPAQHSIATPAGGD